MDQPLEKSEIIIVNIKIDRSHFSQRGCKGSGSNTSENATVDQRCGPAIEQRKLESQTNSLPSSLKCKAKVDNGDKIDIALRGQMSAMVVSEEDRIVIPRRHCVLCHSNRKCRAPTYQCSPGRSRGCYHPPASSRCRCHLCRPCCLLNCSVAPGGSVKSHPQLNGDECLKEATKKTNRWRRRKPN